MKKKKEKSTLYKPGKEGCQESISRTCMYMHNMCLYIKCKYMHVIYISISESVSCLDYNLQDLKGGGLHYKLSADDSRSSLPLLDSPLEGYT